MRVNSPLVSTLLVPTTALAVALGPAVVSAPAGRPAVPVVHVEAVALAGIGQNIYNAITPVVQTIVGDVSYLINFIPLVGGLTAAQINITYFQGIQPSVAATVDYGAALVHAPLDFFPITRGYAQDLYGISYDVVSAELRFLGFQELPPRPTAAAPVSSLPVASPQAAAVESNTPGTPPVQTAVVSPVSEPLSPVRGGEKTRRATPVRDTALPAAAVVATVGEVPAGETVTATAKSPGPGANQQDKPGRRGHRQNRG